MSSLSPTTSSAGSRDVKSHRYATSTRETSRSRVLGRSSVRMEETLWHLPTRTLAISVAGRHRNTRCWRVVFARDKPAEKGPRSYCPFFALFCSIFALKVLSTGPKKDQGIETWRSHNDAGAVEDAEVICICKSTLSSTIQWPPCHEPHASRTAHLDSRPTHCRFVKIIRYARTRRKGMQR